MKIANSSSGRPAFYDRNPISQGQWDNAQALGPHGQVTRSTYTVPTNRKLQLGYTGVLIARKTAAGTPGEYSARVQVQRADFANLTTNILRESNNVALTYFRQAGPVDIVLRPGDTIGDNDLDGSVTGTLDIDESWGGTEFDA